jgi:uncharacterized circularly permuted ATP-grasp superfamily protein/uncharacterized alpha-E superfamily protein
MKMSQSAAANLGGVLQQHLKTYQPEPGRYDELFDSNHRLRPHWAGVLGAFDALGTDETASRRRAAEAIIRENGITYNVYGDPKGMDRPWALDMLPVVLPHDEWAHIECGVKQRVRLLNSTLRDMYGPQRLMYDGVVPPEFLLANPRYLRPCRGITPAQNAHIVRYAADLVRGPDGKWRVYSDRTQAPSGSGYALENRIVMSRTFPDLIADMRVRRLAAFFERFRGILREMSYQRREAPAIVLLTPGPHNETYFEHVYLARYLGFPLVEGEDLTMRDNRIYLKTVEGLQQVDVVLRRVDDAYCDPLELIKNSSLGTTGMLHAMRNQTLAVCNAIGSGALEVPALRAVLPKLCRHFMGEDLILESSRTLWGAMPEHREEINDRFNEIGLLPAFAPAISQVPPTGQLDPGDQDAVRTLWDRRPQGFAVVENHRPSMVPVLKGNAVVPHSLVLRVYAVTNGDGGDVEVMPGGLARFGESDEALTITMQQGSGSKDVWVLSEGPVDFTSLLAGQQRPMHIMRSPGNVPSRLAENLLWLGRYCERSEALVRFLRYVLLRSTEEEGFVDLGAIFSLLRGAPNLFEYVAKQLPDQGDLEHATADSMTGADVEELQRAVLKAVFNAEYPNSVMANLRAIRRAAWVVRERFSEDDWRILIGFVQEFLMRTPEEPDTRYCLDALNKLVTGFSAFSGLILENMTKEPGQIFLDMGRRIERAINTSEVLYHTLPVLEGSPQPVLRGLLAICDSPMTYRSRYGANIQEAPVLDLLLSDETNPRAVAYQLNLLTRHLAALPKHGQPGLLNPEERIIEHLRAEVRVADMDLITRPDENGERSQLSTLLEMLSTELPNFADQLSHRYFIHTAPAQQLQAISVSPEATH